MRSGEVSSGNGGIQRARLGPQNLDDPILDHVRRGLATLRAGQTVGKALAELRAASPADGIIYFYVIDAEGKLVGVVPTRRLLVSQPETAVESIMLRDVISIPADATVLIACEFFVLHRFLALPVTDRAGRLVGVVDVGLFADEVLGLAEKRELDDVFQLIGVHVARGRRPSLLHSFRARFPWLLCNITGGLACALLAGRYERFLDAVIVIALFIPVVLALAESVSIQSMTITLQMLHGARVGWRTFLTLLGRELGTAFLLGAASGTLVGLVAWLWRQQPTVAVAISLSICCSMITACVLGLVLPSAVRAFRGDPKIAAGPIVLAVADLATLLFYFNLAGWLAG